MLPTIILVGIGIFALSKFGVILAAVFSGLGAIFSPIIAYLTSLIPIIGGVGGASAGAAGPVLAFGAAILLMGGGVFLAAAGFSMLVDSMTELFKVASPEQLLSFGAAMMMVNFSLSMLAVTLPILGLMLPVIIALGVAFGALAFAVSMLDFSNLDPLGQLFMGLGQIVSGETSNLKEAMDSVANLTTAISDINDDKKIVAVQQLIESIRGNTATGVPATGAIAGTGTTGPGGGKVVHINLTIGKKQLQPVVGEIIGDMFRLF